MHIQIHWYNITKSNPFKPLNLIHYSNRTLGQNFLFIYYLHFFRGTKTIQQPHHIVEGTIKLKEQESTHDNYTLNPLTLLVTEEFSETPVLVFPGASVSRSFQDAENILLASRKLGKSVSALIFDFICQFLPN